MKLGEGSLVQQDLYWRELIAGDLGNHAYKPSMHPQPGMRGPWPPTPYFTSYNNTFNVNPHLGIPKPAPMIPPAGTVKFMKPYREELLIRNPPGSLEGEKRRMANNRRPGSAPAPNRSAMNFLPNGLTLQEDDPLSGGITHYWLSGGGAHATGAAAGLPAVPPPQRSFMSTFPSAPMGMADSMEMPVEACRYEGRAGIPDTMNLVQRSGSVPCLAPASLSYDPPRPGSASQYRGDGTTGHPAPRQRRAEQGQLSRPQSAVALGRSGGGKRPATPSSRSSRSDASSKTLSSTRSFCHEGSERWSQPRGVGVWNPKPSAAGKESGFWDRPRRPHVDLW